MILQILFSVVFSLVILNASSFFNVFFSYCWERINLILVSSEETSDRFTFLSGSKNNILEKHLKKYQRYIIEWKLTIMNY